MNRLKNFFCSLILLLLPLSVNAESEQCPLISLGPNTVGSVQEVKGFFTSSFEHSGFTPCDRPGEQWWVHAPYHADMLSSEMSKLGGTRMKAPERRLFMKVTVCMSNEGAFGHMGAYSRYLKIMQVLERHPESANDCDAAEPEQEAEQP